MLRLLPLLASALLLTACGADGPPQRPQGGEAVSGIFSDTSRSGRLPDMLPARTY